MAPDLPGAAALGAGLAAGIAVLALAWSQPALTATALLERRRAARIPPSGQRRWHFDALSLPAGGRLAHLIEQAGWRESPERFVLAAAAIVTAGALTGAAAGSLGGPPSAAGLGTAGASAGAGLAFQHLRSAAVRRRTRLLAELAPTLDLLGIELSGGSSPLAGLAAVTRHGDGDLARAIRSLLAATSVSSDRSADARLQELGERLDLPPLVSLATILATSRDYGSGVSHAIRLLALDLRRARRRELIATSRRALSRVLVPAAVGVLLPFLAILLYPAVTALSASFR